MKITLTFFAVLQEEISDKSLEIDISEGSTANDLISLLSKKYPKVAEILNVTRLAYKDEYIGKKSILVDGAEYSLIPPVSGG